MKDSLQFKKWKTECEGMKLAAVASVGCVLDMPKEETAEDEEDEAGEAAVRADSPEESMNSMWFSLQHSWLWQTASEWKRQGGEIEKKEGLHKPRPHNAEGQNRKAHATKTIETYIFFCISNATNTL